MHFFKAGDPCNYILWSSTVNPKLPALKLSRQSAKQTANASKTAHHSPTPILHLVFALFVGVDDADVLVAVPEFVFVALAAVLTSTQISPVESELMNILS